MTSAESPSHGALYSGVSIVRAAVALVLLGAAAIHFIETRSHFEEDVLYGWFFIAMGSGQLAGAVVLLLRPVRWVFIAAALGNLAIVLVWLITRTIGIPFGAEAGTRELVGVPDVVATILELLAVAGTLFLLFVAPRVHFRGVRGAVGSVIVLCAAALVMGSVVFAATNRRVACVHFHPRYGPLAAVDGHSILSRYARQDPMKAGEVGLVKAGLIVNCGNKPLTVGRIQVVSSAGDSGSVESFEVLPENYSEGVPVGHHRTAVVKPTGEGPKFAVFARLRAGGPGVFYLNGVRIIYIYKGRTLSQVFATNVSVEIQDP